jgi:hypothetical protein
LTVFLPQAHRRSVRKTQGGQRSLSWQAWATLGWPQVGGGRTQGYEQLKVRPQAIGGRMTVRSQWQTSSSYEAIKQGGHGPGARASRARGSATAGQASEARAGTHPCGQVPGRRGCRRRAACRRRADKCATRPRLRHQQARARPSSRQPAAAGVCPWPCRRPCMREGSRRGRTRAYGTSAGRRTSSRIGPRSRPGALPPAAASTTGGPAGHTDTRWGRQPTICQPRREGGGGVRMRIAPWTRHTGKGGRPLPCTGRRAPRGTPDHTGGRTPSRAHRQPRTSARCRRSSSGQHRAYLAGRPRGGACRKGKL